MTQEDLKSGLRIKVNFDSEVDTGEFIGSFDVSKLAKYDKLWVVKFEYHGLLICSIEKLASPLWGNWLSDTLKIGDWIVNPMNPKDWCHHDMFLMLELKGLSNYPGMFKIVEVYDPDTQLWNPVGVNTGPVKKLKLEKENSMPKTKDTFLIKITLGSWETSIGAFETDWVGFLHEAGEPVEYDTIEEARIARDHVSDGSQTFDLFEPWDVDSGARPIILSATVCKVSEVE